VFDIEIRRTTGGRKGLTDVLLKLIEQKPNGGIVQRPDFLAMLKQVSGKDMEALYRHVVEDDGAIDLATHLNGTGFRIAAKTRAIEIRPETDAEKKLLEAILSE
jgi:predicted metalloprotease with PDZ domain